MVHFSKAFSAACVLRFSLADGFLCRDVYWSWERITPLKGAIDIHETGREWGKRFVAAVEKRVRPHERAGLMLSGGLDSRSILAAFPLRGDDVHAATFGKRGCQDIRIAAEAAAVKKAQHHTFEINEHNWLHPRLAGVWRTERSIEYQGHAWH